MNSTTGQGQSSCRNHEDDFGEPIAIIGMAMRLPGGVRCGDEFWDMLVNKRDGFCEAPPSRCSREASSSPDCGDLREMKKGFFLQEDPACFDASFFSVPPHEAARLDPQQRLLLEVVWECLENSGETKWRGEKIGCFVGVFGEDWLEISHKDPQHLNQIYPIATGSFALANQVSYRFDLLGPSMTIQTACSSSLVCLNEASQALRSGECSTALVGGTSLIWGPTMTDAMTKNMVLSPSGISHTFDADADGYGRGEGINCIYLKPLRDALRDNDAIRAVIRSTVTNHDGKTPNFSQPCPISQERLIRHAYQIAGIDAIHETPVFECHGTGTAVGDVIEASVVAKMTQGEVTYITAVKPNVGHSEGASGITSIIKSILSLENKTIAPNIHFKTPNPQIPFQDANLHVPLEPTLWPAGRPQRISVNSFGIGGSNAHAILESASTISPKSQNASLGISDPQLLVISAHTVETLRKRIAQIVDYVKNHPSRIHDLSYTLAARRSHLPHRAFAVVHPTKATIDDTAFTIFNTSSPSVTFVFTGQGAQWPGMGLRLLSSFPIFKEDIKIMDEALQQLPDGPNWLLYDELRQESSISRIHEAEFSQPLCIALQIGLVNILRGWGIEPSTVVGHSSGEIVAAYAARAISMRTAIIIAYYRGKVAKPLEGSGAMVAVGLTPDEVVPYLTPGVVVACHNSPHSVTLSGDKDSIDRAIKNIKAANSDTLCRRLTVKIAYHSDHMKQIGSEYEHCISHHIEYEEAMLPFCSSVTGDTITDPRKLDASYWRQNLESPVLFTEAIQSLPTSGTPVFLEVGPHSALAAPLRQIFRILSARSPVYIPTLFRYEEDVQTQLLCTAGQAHATGLGVNLSSITELGNTLTDLPPYPWQHDRPYWSESRLSREWRQRAFPHHEVLGSRVVDTTDHEPSWRNLVTLDNVSWLLDHLIQGAVTFPGAGFVAMVGEAVQQLHPDNDSYSVRNMTFITPLLFHEGDQIEMVTSLSPVEVADRVPSGWYGFKIMAHDGERWTMHCQGQVRAGSDHPPESFPISSYKRSVPSEGVYRVLQRSGIDYGSQFQGLEKITADPTGPRATATVLGNRGLPGSRYSLHPTAIDQCLQLMGVACSQGLLRHLTTIYVPAMIDSLFVGSGGPPMSASARTKRGTRDGQLGDAIAMLGDKVVLSIQGAYLFALENDNIDSGTGVAGSLAHLEWKSGIDFLPLSALLSTPLDYTAQAMNIKALGQISVLFVLETADKIEDVEPASPHSAKWKKFIIDAAFNIKTSGRQSIYPESPQWALLSSSDRQEMIRKVLAETKFTFDAPLVDCTQVVFDNCIAFTSGESNPLEVLVKDNLLHKFHGAHTQYADWKPFLPLLCHSNPGLRILEIGAGTGSATAMALELLKSPSGERMYSQYVFTDISSGFMAAATERFGHEQGMEYKVLDITLDPLEQGFDAHSFDLIIASNVLHATPSLHPALCYVHLLLKPTGRFLLHEICPEILTANFTMGVFPGWWLGEDDGRSDQPYISPERWDRELRAAGFTGADVIAYDHKPPYHVSASMLSRPVDEITIPNDIWLLKSNSTPCEWASDVELQVRDKGYITNWTTLHETPPQGKFVVSLLDLQGAPIGSLPKDDYEVFQRYIEQAQECQILWVTQSTSHTCSDPIFGFIHGLARTLRAELLLDISILEVPAWDTASAKAVVQVCEKIQRSRAQSLPDPEYEFALHEGEIKVGRYHWTPLVEQLASPPRSDSSRKLALTTYGLLDTLHWAEKEASYELNEEHVEVEMDYVGLNFKDMMVAMGFFGNKEDLGLEGSGIVLRVGADVTDITVGDRVVLMHSGVLASNVVVPHEACIKLPQGLSMADAATMLTAYVTVLYSLLEIGALKKGQSVLIHSACGGVGLAALQVCQAVGTEIYATVGNEKKVAHLMEHFGLPRERIFNSRNTSFQPDLMRATAGRGVDVVLNSLSGNLLHASWECVAKFGRMVELGKRDFISHGMLNMSLFEANRAFFGVDLAQVCKETPKILKSTLATFSDWYRQGKIGPIKPVKVFDAIDIVSAFRYMQAGTHLGKILVRMPTSVESLPPPVVKTFPTFRSDAAYLLIGGLGGIGRSVSTWMVEQNARELIFLSRSAGKSEEDQAFIQELETQGCQVICVPGNVTNLNNVKEAVATCTRPLAGILQMAVDLNDRLFLQMSHEEWEAALAPKVAGTWNLHHATLKHSLDFFVVFGSIAGVCGNTGQANYAAATTFLEAFTRYRRQQGLPSSILHLGVVGDVGAASRNSRFLQRIQSIGLHVLHEGEVIDALAAAINISPVSGSNATGAMAMGLAHTRRRADLPKEIFLGGRDARFSIYPNLESTSDGIGGDSSSHANALKALLAQIQADPSLTGKKETEVALMKELGKFISHNLTGQTQEEGPDSADDTEALAGMPVDSLMAIEVRNWLRRSLGLEIPTVEINRAGTLGGLVKVVLKGLGEKYDQRAT
ncbi:Acyl transferase/acyl hydrolase/lysophospholipase [Penicillium expansum]|uniref:Acyl transferase/acyl hydrolase/lysophospholipase n=1 Tax=Penicillium expansum TaxID=27334 RepID=A0A0A2IUY4_PENEN|nr:Acyl transferase/acyl hydrolase/lysophospholipase [Penicillium expansum]KGO46306.1 Acyl transferase/acyl hydrolase/lysophospholipase [Penicillium expansum]KGO58154.1 Acyl transferase/acyl hydrolase/lysophospholipase [Penicillium expansum]